MYEFSTPRSPLNVEAIIQLHFPGVNLSWFSIDVIETNN